MQEYRNNQGHTHGQESDKIFLIEPLLPVGKENRISSSELVRLAGCGSVRELQKRIAWEREQGAIICSGCGAGYWRPANRDEIKGVIKDAVKDSAKRGTTFDTTQYKWVQEDIEKLAKEIEVAEREQDKLFATGKPFELGSKARAAKEDLEKLSQEEGKLADMHNKLQTAYDGVNDKINEYSQKADEATASTSRLSRITKKLGYDKISACTFVPVIKTDYQAYLRKALKILDDPNHLAMVYGFVKRMYLEEQKEREKRHE